MKFVNDTLTEFIGQSTDGVIVFGTLNIAMALMDEIAANGECEKVLYFLDNDSSLWGKELKYGDHVYLINDPRVLKTEKRNISLIIASTYIYDIAAQLQAFEELRDTKCCFYTFMRWCRETDLSDYLEQTKRLRARYADQKELFERVKGSFDGKRCFIVGNGPSLTPHDLHLIRDEFCFGSNQIFFAFPKTDWRPDAYLTVNVDTIMAYQSVIEGVECKYKFIDSKALDYGVEIENALYLKHGTFQEGEDLFSKDISEYYYNGGTVTYTAIQVAVYMGFKEIYLIGVDNNYSTEKKKNGEIVENNIQNHFYSDQEDKKTADLYRTTDVDHLTESFMTAKRYADQNGIRIYNATRGGKLEVFPRVELETVLSER